MTQEEQRGMGEFHASSTAQWRDWLVRNGGSEREVWLVIGHKDSARASVRYHEAIEQALCYGWIDSQARRHDADSSLLRFTPRTSRSPWSRVNRERAARLTEAGLMAAPGQAMIDLARTSGTWPVGPDADSEAVPADLRELLDQSETAAAHFERFPPSSKRLILQWVAGAKRPETRQRRIRQTVELAARNVRANHPARRP